MPFPRHCCRHELCYDRRPESISLTPLPSMLHGCEWRPLGACYPPGVMPVQPCSSHGKLACRHINGHPGEPPVRPNISLGDTLAGLHGALGAVMALLHRQRHLGHVPGQVGL